MQLSFGIKAADIVFIKENLIEYARSFELACILDSNSHYYKTDPVHPKKYDLIAGFSLSESSTKTITDLNALESIQTTDPDWRLGYLTYDLKNDFENLRSDNPDYLNWPPVFFFKPDILILLENLTLTISSYSESNCLKIYKTLIDSAILNSVPYTINLKPRLSKEEYLRKIQEIQQYISAGELYEVNFCLELYAKVNINPYSYFRYLNRLSPAPFASFLKIQDKFLLSMSPERYIKKEDTLVLMQPMKGTAPRGTPECLDLFLKNELMTSSKERAENIMIVDLVRNDLSKIALYKSVNVEELCKVYSFPHVHQMISSISARLKTGKFSEIIKATFPMGSMTGAPKVAAMKIIEMLESTKRGLYSGAIGYIAPSSNFDFSVVIRSLQYNGKTDYLSYIVGSAITAESNPQKEYEECLLKVYGIQTNLNQPDYAH
jgi:para-aminobenzoate synthetase component I